MKKGEPEEEGTGYSWMDTYGDMVTLLLCFFVLLYSFSSLNATKAAELVSAFSGSKAASAIQAFDITTAREEPISTIDEMINYESRGGEDGEDAQVNNVEIIEKQEEIDKAFDELFYIIKTYIETNDLSGQMSVDRTDDVIILRFNEMALFDSGEAKILPASLPTLDHFIQIISENIGSISNVNIEGHTDNVPISNPVYPSNWELSSGRAANVVSLFAQQGVDPQRMVAIGYGEFQPAAGNETAEDRARNRRVSIVVLPGSLPRSGERMEPERLRQDYPQPPAEGLAPDPTQPDAGPGAGPGPANPDTAGVGGAGPRPEAPAAPGAAPGSTPGSAPASGTGGRGIGQI